MYMLIIEDDEKASAQLKKGLAEANVFTDVANDGLLGLSLAQKKVQGKAPTVHHSPHP